MLYNSASFDGGLRFLDIRIDLCNDWRRPVSCYFRLLSFGCHWIWPWFHCPITPGACSTGTPHLVGTYFNRIIVVLIGYYERLCRLWMWLPVHNFCFCLCSCVNRRTHRYAFAYIPTCLHIRLRRLVVPFRVQTTLAPPPSPCIPHGVVPPPPTLPRHSAASQPISWGHQVT